MLAQYVEYKVSNYLDKAYETIFGFVSVLPGAFATFRWNAIQGSPLDAFFKGMNKSSPSEFVPCKVANQYLAEDRIFCLEILIKKVSSERSGTRKDTADHIDGKNRSYILNYISGCRAVTDPPDSIVGMIK